ncbi:hypothetical protein KC19_8G186300 [Ceratodon purpureus]|uniref:Uncharacterized protein n=1 Tax=Ceratodon purpureus TaxID=3225 RepID=A0A8T0H0F5_CERPU|nr:hypothetical protein KC19_8G186300 [Ceratodon purpureus]
MTIQNMCYRHAFKSYLPKTLEKNMKKHVFGGILDLWQLIRVIGFRIVYRLLLGNSSSSCTVLLLLFTFGKRTGSGSWKFEEIGFGWRWFGALSIVAPLLPQFPVVAHKSFR